MRFSLCELWSPAVSDQAQAASVFAEEAPIALIEESPSAPTRVAVLSASYDVLQWLQIPNFDV